jgi:quercetin dioxygenase-like cupin family protein
MATDAERSGEGAEENGAASSDEGGGSSYEAGAQGYERDIPKPEVFPHFIEIWNDYDPSQRFTVIFPVGEAEGAVGSSVAYYIIEPGSHTGLHSDNVEEIAFVAEGEGEVFSTGITQKLEAGKFVVFPAGSDHDIYAHGIVALRLLSFFPTLEIVSTFQQAVYPLGETTVSSKPPAPIVTELDPNNLPADFPFSLDDLGLGGQDEPRELSMTQRLIGMTDPDKPPENIEVKIYTPGEEPIVEIINPTPRKPEDEAASEG